MAINTLKNKIVLRLCLEDGIADGKIILKNKNYSRIKPSTNDDDLYEVGILLSELQEKDLLEISKVETSILTKE